MPRAFVLMTALPPTTGHIQLIEFASNLADTVTIMLTTQPDEPFVQERVDALYQATERLPYRPSIVHYSRPMNPDPSSEGFRDRWAGIMIGAGAEPGDLLVISEPWGQWLAEMTGMDWRPYDVERQINDARATQVRQFPHHYWSKILPEFRKHLQVRVTIFGAESTGKTTLARRLGISTPDTIAIPEYARPYLENTVNEITTRSMTAIWEGQRALQRQQFLDYALVIQDTDLYSTLGYWNYWRNNVDYSRPRFEPRLPYTDLQPLREDARELRSDLYLICPSNIPFEADPLRYGGDKREIEDDWWMNFLAWENSKKYGLDYHVLTGESFDARRREAAGLIEAVMTKKAKLIEYDRHGF